MTQSCAEQIELAYRSFAARLTLKLERVRSPSAFARASESIRVPSEVEPRPTDVAKQLHNAEQSFALSSASFTRRQSSGTTTIESPECSAIQPIAMPIR